MSGASTTTRPDFVTPPPVQPGDTVAILSPSWAGPGVFPEVHERAMILLRRELGLVPIEFPTTRQVGASPRERARDLMAAFLDGRVRAVFASIGGEDQLTVLPYLDAEVFRAHPKRFFGYSDNTNFLNFLWNQGVVGYHGGSTMVHFGRAGGVDPVTMSSLRTALFTNDTVTLEPVRAFTDLSGDWNDLSTLTHPVETFEEPGWHWHHAEQVVTGRTWGGNLEILDWNLASNRWILPNEHYQGCVLILETSEEMPSGEAVFRMLRNFGERGLLVQFPAVVVAKPKAWHHGRATSLVERRTFHDDQRAAVLAALATYNPTSLAVFGPDFGHTDPQLIIPYGGEMTIDGLARSITMTY